MQVSYSPIKHNSTQKAKPPSGALVAFMGGYKAKFKKQIKTYPQDIFYRQTLAEEVGMKKTDAYLLRPIIGLQELEEIAQSFTMKDYMPGIRKSLDVPDDRDFSLATSGDFRANLHIHSKNSDGVMSVEEILNQAVKIADINAQKMKKTSKMPNAPFVIGIADHDTVKQNIEVVNLIKKDPYKYRNLRIVMATEISAEKQDNMPKAHVLMYGLNPFDDKFWEKKPSGFVDMIKHFSSQKYGAFGIAHPARMINMGAPGDVAGFFDDFLGSFKALAKEKAKFVENHYQSYYGKCVNFLGDISNISKKHGFLSTGGIDSHKNNILTASKYFSDNELINIIG
ncbi:MAG: hypothetical protein PHE78_04415 [Candidatus Gastranaerophilales bacterium]|nr:hypothetical protein [Candidatus Gastranaerophilales bacterium]